MKFKLIYFSYLLKYNRLCFIITNFLWIILPDRPMIYRNKYLFPCSKYIFSEQTNEKPDFD